MKTRFHRPRSLADALSILGDLGDAAWPIAGGTDLTLQIRMGRREPRDLVAVTGIGLDGIREESSALVLGAAAPLVALMAHAAVRRRLPSLAAACGQIGGPQIQTVATLGGNLGNASPAADSVPPLLVDEACVRLESKAGGAREVPLAGWFLGPGKTVRRPDELITAIVVPPPRSDGGRVLGTFRKYGPRRSNIISAVTFAARLTLSDDGTLEDVRFALGSVAPTPIRAPKTEAWLAGRRLEPGLANEGGLADAVAADVRPITDVRGSDRYKTQLALNSVRFALHEALEGAKGVLS